MAAVDVSRLRWPATISVYCPADVEISRHGLFVIGSPALMGAALLGQAIGTGIGNARARRLAAPQWRRAGQGEVLIREDCLMVWWPGSEWIRVFFRTITSWAATKTGLEIQRAGWGPIRLDVQEPSSLQQWFGYMATGKTWKPPTLQTLQITWPMVGWCQQYPGFTFGLPQGWIAATPEWFGMAARKFAPAQVVVGVHRPDTPHSMYMNVLAIPPGEEITPEMIEKTPDECAAALAMFSNSAFEDPIELINLDGERGTIFHLSYRGSDPTEILHFFVTHAGRFFAGEFLVDAPSAASYQDNLPQLHSMLATWHWYT